MAVSGATVVARPDGDDQNRGKDAGHIGGRLRYPNQQGQPHADHHRAHAHLEARPDRGGHPARPGREHQHDQGQGQQCHPGLEGGVVVDHLEGHGKEEEHAAQAGIDDEGHRVGDRELPVGEETEREHRRR